MHRRPPLRSDLLHPPSPPHPPITLPAALTSTGEIDSHGAVFRCSPLTRACTPGSGAGSEPPAGGDVLLLSPADCARLMSETQAPRL